MAWRARRLIADRADRDRRITAAIVSSVRTRRRGFARRTGAGDAPAAPRRRDGHPPGGRGARRGRGARVRGRSQRHLLAEPGAHWSRAREMPRLHGSHRARQHFARSRSHSTPRSSAARPPRGGARAALRSRRGAAGAGRRARPRLRPRRRSLCGWARTWRSSLPRRGRGSPAVARLVGDDGEEPGPEGRVGPEPAEIAKRLDERILDRILRFVARDPVGETERRRSGTARPAP